MMTVVVSEAASHATQSVVARQRCTLPRIDHSMPPLKLYSTEILDADENPHSTPWGRVLVVGLPSSLFLSRGLFFDTTSSSSKHAPACELALTWQRYLELTFNPPPFRGWTQNSPRPLPPKDRLYNLQERRNRIYPMRSMQ